VAFNVVWLAVLSVVVGVIAGAAGLRLAQYAILGAVVGMAVQLGAVHMFDWARAAPVLFVVVGCALTVGFGKPSVGVAFAPSARPNATSTNSGVTR
jgi:hypothetical protein